MRRFVVSKEARRDLREIKNYIAEDSIASARRVLAKFRHAFLELGKSPGMGHTPARPHTEAGSLLASPLVSHHLSFRGSAA